MKRPPAEQLASELFDALKAEAEVNRKVHAVHVAKIEYAIFHGHALSLATERERASAATRESVILSLEATIAEFAPFFCKECGAFIADEADEDESPTHCEDCYRQYLADLADLAGASAAAQAKDAA